MLPSWLRRIWSRWGSQRREDELAATISALSGLHGALLAERTILLDAALTDHVATAVIAKLLFLNDDNPTAPALLLLDSPGGQVAAALAIRDTIDHVSCPVHMHVLDEAAGVAAMLLAHGVRGERAASPNSLVTLARISSHERAPSSSDLQRTEAVVAELLAADTGQAVETVVEDMRAERSFKADDARAYGFIDRIAEPRARGLPSRGPSIH
jgi:ATP-dependent Clp protease protease subunit